MSILIAPSVLSADFADLKKEINSIEKAGADWIHIDVMDGNFVPNITVGPVVVKSLRKYTSLPFDVHLMIEQPERYIEDFSKAGANLLTVHPEACKHLHRTLSVIRDQGVKAGVALNPSTPLSSIEYILDQVDLILIMTVNPGFGGQKFIPSLVKKIEYARKLIDQSGYNIHLEVDGGINPETGEIVYRAGARVLVAGNAIFNACDRKQVIQQLKSFSK
jgi:ribulose-phosphate 3-epimerase